MCALKERYFSMPREAVLLGNFSWLLLHSSFFILGPGYGNTEIRKDTSRCPDDLNQSHENSTWYSVDSSSRSSSSPLSHPQTEHILTCFTDPSGQELCISPGIWLVLYIESI